MNKVLAYFLNDSVNNRLQTYRKLLSFVDVIRSITIALGVVAAVASIAVIALRDCIMPIYAMWWFGFVICVGVVCIVATLVQIIIRMVLQSHDN